MEGVVSLESTVVSDFDLEALISESVDSLASTEDSSSATMREQDDIVECPICHEVSQQPFLHYGARACTSCRAFFRRAVQKCIDDKKAIDSTNAIFAVSTLFVCRLGNDNCVLTPSTRKKCQFCRIQACLKAGMRPECVMSDEQKRRRFRNVLKLENNESGSKWKWTPRKGRRNAPNPRVGDNGNVLNASSETTGPIRTRSTRSSTSSLPSSTWESSRSPPLQVAPSVKLTTTNSSSSTWPVSTYVACRSGRSWSEGGDESTFSDQDWTLTSSSPWASPWTASCSSPSSSTSSLPQLSSHGPWSSVGPGLTTELRALSAHASELYAESDRAWLSDQVGKLRVAYRQIDLGAEMVREIVMYRFGEPLSKFFVSRIINVFVERFKRVLNVSYTFKVSNRSEKQALLRNVYRASALMFARACSTTSGAQQVRELAGDGDERVLQTDFAPLTDLGMLRKIHMREINAVNSIMDETTLANYCDHIQKLSCVTNERDDDLFFLTLLITLFRVQERREEEEEEEFERVNKCCNAYSYLVDKRLRMQSNDNESEVRRRWNIFNEAIRDIDGLANILKNMQTSNTLALTPVEESQ